MSPLARCSRSLLALACAALLCASSTDAVNGLRRVSDDGVTLPIAELKMGIVDDADTNLRRITLQPTIVPPKNSTTDFLIPVANKANKDEALVGQNLAATDLTHTATKMTLTPLHKGHHSPLKLHCTPQCPKGVLINADQYAIKIIG